MRIRWRMRRGLPKSGRLIAFACTLICAGAIGFFSGLYVGSSTYIVPSLARLNGQYAEIYDGRFESAEHVGNIDVQALLPVLQAATWTNEKLMRKGAWGLQLRDGTKIWISYYGDFFWVSEVRGYYLIQTAHLASFKAYMSKLSDQVIEWRLKRNSMQK